MIEAAEKGYLTFSKLEAMTSVCSVGLDMIAIPGETPADTIAGIIADEMAIGMINKKLLQSELYLRQVKSWRLYLLRRTSW